MHSRKRARINDNPFSSLPGFDDTPVDATTKLREFALKLYSSGPRHLVGVLHFAVGQMQPTDNVPKDNFQLTDCVLLPITFPHPVARA
jgi:hypothetical protein